MRTSAPWLALLLVLAAVAPVSGFAAADHSATHTIPADSGPESPPATVSGSASDALSAPSVIPQADNEDAGPPRTTVEISLRSDRSAYWRIEAHYALDSGNETRAFRTLATRYESGDADVGPDIALFESLAQRASESTGREMAIQNVTYHSSLDEEAGRGTLALTFEWTNFLRQGDNETLILDDVFTLPTTEADERRTWLSIFDEDQQILIRPPDGYTDTGTSIAVQKRESAIILVEPSDFEGEGEALEVTYSPAGPAERLPIGLLVGGGFVLIVALLSGAWLFRNRDDPGTLPWDSPTRPDDGAATTHSNGANPSGREDGTAPEATEGTTSRVPESEAAEVLGENAQGAAVETGDGTGDGQTTADAEIDLSLLSDEERVEHLLEQNGGRMKQATIVDETGWSDAKVSQLLSTMADDGRIDKLRLGRENLISLPDDETAAESADGSDAADDGEE